MLPKAKAPADPNQNESSRGRKGSSKSKVDNEADAKELSTAEEGPSRKGTKAPEAPSRRSSRNNSQSLQGYTGQPQTKDKKRRVSELDQSNELDTTSEEPKTKRSKAKKTMEEAAPAGIAGPSNVGTELQDDGEGSPLAVPHTAVDSHGALPDSASKHYGAADAAPDGDEGFEDIEFVEKALDRSRPPPNDGQPPHGPASAPGAKSRPLSPSPAPPPPPPASTPPPFPSGYGPHQNQRAHPNQPLFEEEDERSSMEIDDPNEGSPDIGCVVYPPGHGEDYHPETEDDKITCTFFWDNTITTRIDLDIRTLLPCDRAAEVIRAKIEHELARDTLTRAQVTVYDIRVVWPWHGGWSTWDGLRGLRRETRDLKGKRLARMIEIAVAASPHAYLQFRLKNTKDGNEVTKLSFGAEKDGRHLVPSPDNEPPPNAGSKSQAKRRRRHDEDAAPKTGKGKAAVNRNEEHDDIPQDEHYREQPEQPSNMSVDPVVATRERKQSLRKKGSISQESFTTNARTPANYPPPAASSSQTDAHRVKWSGVRELGLETDAELEERLKQEEAKRYKE